ncbi:hypothetical protein [Streptomyces aureocirculatus]|uniref:hypothetical protein n=1 Tax=Streptomyces aureocirculatus TaxID=67275 RepID=UPI0004C849EE|nr:hypothetical protein [Streptomyces aureocirculatus]
MRQVHRRLAIRHLEKKHVVTIQTSCVCSQSNWLDIFATVLDGHGTSEFRTGQVRMWAFGDVLTVSNGGVCLTEQNAGDGIELYVY